MPLLAGCFLATREVVKLLAELNPCADVLPWEDCAADSGGLFSDICCLRCLLSLYAIAGLLCSSVSPSEPSDRLLSLKFIVFPFASRCLL